MSGFLNLNRGQWSGMMHMVYVNEELVCTGKAGIQFLPMIDLNPSDMTCIFSTINFIKRLAEKKTMNQLYLHSTNHCSGRLQL